MGTAYQLDDLLLGHRLADAADAIAMRYFYGRPLAARLKADGTVVSDADLVVEEALVQLVLRERPGDAILGEEGGAVGEGSRVWIIDPIDGTSSFLAGGRTWATGIALVVEGEPVVGVISNPCVSGRYWGASGAGAFRAGRAGAERIEVSRPQPARGSTAATWPLGVREEAVLRRLCVGRPPQVVPPVDVLEGVLDACLYVGAAPWDLAAFAVLVEAAGGRFSDGHGGRRLDAGTGLFTNGGPVHEAILAGLESTDELSPA